MFAEKIFSNKWLTEQLNKNKATVSRWCTNDVQPILKTLVEIAGKLNVKLAALFND